MKGEFIVRNRQKAWPLDLAFFRSLVKVLLTDYFTGCHCELGIHLIGANEMECLNQTFLSHEGPTDVITFDYAEPAQSDQLHGDIFLCPEVAVTQAEQYGTTPGSELLRYLIHGILHLRGFDDQTTAERRLMKREETRLLRLMESRFLVADLKRKGKPGCS